VEQRFFGSSTPDAIIELSNLESLKMDNVINDHVTLIKILSNQYGAKNFLVFGGGHGGIIAGYVANHFATSDELRKDYNVLGWR
jgi:hypothetical protein